jgi:DNA-binding beta-propeller fold protein YncE
MRGIVMCAAVCGLCACVLYAEPDPFKDLRCGAQGACPPSLVCGRDGFCRTPAPAIAGSTPASPSRERALVLRGSADPRSTVRIYTNSSCGGTAVASGTADESAVFRVSVVAAANEATTFYATASNAFGNTSHCSDGFTYRHDDLAPSPGTVTIPSCQSSTTTVEASWSAFSDTGSGIQRYEHNLSSTAACSGDLAPTTSVESATTRRTTGLNLAEGTTFVVCVRAVDGAGNASDFVASHVAKVDFTPPFLGVVQNEASAPLVCATAIDSSWSGFADQGCGIERYELNLSKSEECAGDAVATTSVGNVTSWRAEGLSLTEGANYFTCVRAVDGAGNASAWAVSGGLRIGPTIVARIPVGPSLGGIGVNPQTNKVYAVGFESVAVIDAITHNVVATVPVAASSYGVGVDVLTNRVFVASGAFSGKLTIIDGATDTVVETVITDRTLNGLQLALDSLTNRLYLPSFDPEGQVVVFDATELHVASRIWVARNPFAAAVNPNTRRVYVGHGAFFGRRRLTVIDTASEAVSDGPEVGLGASAIAVDPVSDRIYVRKGHQPANDPYEVVVVDGPSEAVLSTIPAAAGGGGIAVDAITHRVYAVAGSSRELLVIDGAPGSPTVNTVVARVDLGTVPNIDVGVNPQTGNLYVSTDADGVIVLNDRTTRTDPRNCGTCGNACDAPGGGTAACLAGRCVGSCPSGQQVCGGSPSHGGGTCASSCLPQRSARMLVFGGSGAVTYNDVWALSLAPQGSPSWTEIQPGGTPPSPRHGASAVYDSTRDRVLVYGGVASNGFSSEVFALSLGTLPTWAPLSPLGNAPLRGSSAVAYEAAGDRLVVTQGEGPPVDVTCHADTYALDFGEGPAWSALSPSGIIPEGYAGGVGYAYHPASKRFWIHGGGGAWGSGCAPCGGGICGGYSDTHVLSLTSGVETWTTLEPSGDLPPGASGLALVWDPVGSRLVRFGGGAALGAVWDSTWVLSFPESGTPTWIEIQASVRPPPWTWGAAVYDPVGRRMLIFGGASSDGAREVNRKVWALDLSSPGAVGSWSQLEVTGTPPAARMLPAYVYIPAGVDCAEERCRVPEL